MAKISAIDIKKLWYTECVEAAVTPSTLKALVNGTAKEITNVHQDTWSIEEGEASQDSYKNQLNGHVYRMGKRQMGDLTVAFTIGQYDYATKAALMGGSVLNASGSVVSNPTGASTEVGWKRSDEPVELYKTLIALTYDDVYVVLTNAAIGAREGQTDGAIGISMNGTMMDSKTSGVASEYWYDKTTVDNAS